MPGVVLDASFALAFMLPDEAQPLPGEALAGAAVLGLTVPELWWIEVGHAALQAVRHGRMTEAERRDGLARLARLPIETDAEGRLFAWTATTALAERHRLSLYDATYLELALRLGAALATLDAALRRAAAAEGVALQPA
ncbi:type II toxin-antitoxin system VapC family toxin [Paracraurococcus ruber]|nr:type II toxin-antitoxin system VapC family toxin [Paracraurococcus ruber]